MFYFVPRVTMVILFGVLAACSTTDRKITELPIPTNFKAESMMKLQSVSHWNNIAVDMADGISKKYGSGGGCIPGNGCRTPIFVSEPTPKTQFSKAFRNQLVSALVNRGLPLLSEAKPDATMVDIDIQLVSYQRGKGQMDYDRKPMELVDGVWVIRDIDDTAVKTFKTITTQQWNEGETNRSEWFKSPFISPAIEMLVTISFVKDKHYLARTSNVYYLDSDVGFVPPKPTLVNAWKILVEGDCTPSRCITK